MDAQKLNAGKHASEKDMRVLRALRNIFDAFATPLDSDAGALVEAAISDTYLQGQPPSLMSNQAP